MPLKTSDWTYFKKIPILSNRAKSRNHSNEAKWSLGIFQATHLLRYTWEKSDYHQKHQTMPGEEFGFFIRDFKSKILGSDQVITQYYTK